MYLRTLPAAVAEEAVIGHQSRRKPKFPDAVCDAILRAVGLAPGKPTRKRVRKVSVYVGVCVWGGGAPTASNRLPREHVHCRATPCR